MRKSLMVTLLGIAVFGVGALLAEEPAPPAPLGKAELASRRAGHLEALKAYAKAGVFPHNHDFKGERRPHLMDRHGRLCAVGYLIAGTVVGEEFDYGVFRQQNDKAWRHEACGPTPPEVKPDPRVLAHAPASELFRKLAAADNTIRVMDVKDGPILDWILTSGLTQEECALIQPGYSYLTCNDCLPGSEPGGRCFGEVAAGVREQEAQDRTRIQAHLAKVIETLEAQTEASLATALVRLEARGQQIER